MHWCGGTSPCCSSASFSSASAASFWPRWAIVRSSWPVNPAKSHNLDWTFYCFGSWMSGLGLGCSFSIKKRHLKVIKCSQASSHSWGGMSSVRLAGPCPMASRVLRLAFHAIFVADFRRLFISTASVSRIQPQSLCDTDPHLQSNLAIMNFASL